MGGKYKPYPKYKVSEIEWLGDMPEGWNKYKLRWSTKIFSGGTPSKDNLEYWEGGTIPWINSGAINQITINQPSTYITTLGFKSSSAKWIPQDSLVIALAGQGKTKGNVAYLSIPTTCNQSVAAIVVNDCFYTKYLFYWLKTNYENIRNIAGGNLRDGLNLEYLKDISCPHPPLPEQRQIADFLDQEVGKIEALIAKQERLVELLTEKRQAVISHAVTKGLNPNTPMKPSAIDWLGDIPEHWKILRLKNILKIKNGRDYKDIEVDNKEDGYPVYGSGGIFKFSSDFLYDGVSILFGRKGTIDKPLIVNGKFWTVDTMFYSELYPNINALYIYNQSLLFPYDLLSTSTALPSITQEDLLELAVAIPSLQEQQQIAEFLDQETKKIDSLIQKSKHMVILLKERKTALISAAVTGKIDVRN